MRNSSSGDPVSGEGIGNGVAVRVEILHLAEVRLYVDIADILLAALASQGSQGDVLLAPLSAGECRRVISP